MTRTPGFAAFTASATPAANPGVRVIGVSMDRGAAMHAAFAAGRPVPVEEVPSLADSLGGGLGAPNRLTYALCRALLDDILLVSEAEIARAMRKIAVAERWMVEGAAGVALAGLVRKAEAWRGRRVAVVLCGRNIGVDKFAEAVAQAA